ncbi:DnaJ C-terminal domain-containing protein [Colwellia sp. 6_MG-2023]|uniref:DnaJ C-terminal domain-containing protein n=1 Tax=Colwellia sp. 6_MG-2023 TaxID=3062676 RepID=UPI0026E365A6|nr:DnaJ C-terminal domain-containing protein [Colwellia sp. 6_MG-2023]MDO6488778.1 DnaJ C-terminal domain-containing protein [Colwellia sp. 6_MG-2023]
MDFKDYYKVMGINRDSTSDEIKRAYKKLARKYHPDVNKAADAEVRFKEVGEAYAVLKDPDKRASYDQLGSDWQSGQDFNPPPDWDAGFEFKDGGSSGASQADFSDFFDSLFGRGYGSQKPNNQHQADYKTRGEDHHAKVVIDLEDAYLGATRSIVLQSPELDKQGHVVNKQRTLKIKIPRGVKEGQRIRLSGQGTPSHGGGAAGDIYLELSFNTHSIYRVVEHDVYLDLPITPWEAALGATVKVPTPLGPVDLKIVPATKSGQKLRLKARGIPAKTAGDLYVVTQIVLPPADSEAAKAIYKKMQDELDFNPRTLLGV